jgi:hypothetical protein
MASFSILIPTTNTSGAIIDPGVKGVRGVRESPADNRKYRFATRLNCSNKAFGKNVMRLYLVVET